MSLKKFLFIFMILLSPRVLGVDKPKIFAQIPLQWEITKNEFKGDGTASLTETYRETWQFHFIGQTQIIIKSPRARVKAHGTGIESLTTAKRLPSHIILTESNLRKLLGLPENNLTVDGVEPEHLVSIPLKSPSLVLEDFLIKLPDGDSIKITMNFNQ